MKKSFFVLLSFVLMGLVLVSCDDDEIGNPPSVKVLSASTWAFGTYYDYFSKDSDGEDNDDYDDVDFGNIFYYSDGKSSGIVYCDAFYFKNDNSFTEVYKGETYQGTYKLEGTKLTLNYYGGKDTEVYDLTSDYVNIGGKNVKAFVTKVSLSEEENHVQDGWSDYYKEYPHVFVQVQPSWTFVTFN